ncbi:MAG: beta/gamma crystallin-related protein [Bacteroidia bacterium]|nr:beta/gamma crystallin-related protein [Bacteroidia bacterium]
MSTLVKVYEHEGFRGKSKELKEGEYASMSSIIGNDKISSLRVPEGYYIRIYADSGFRGRNIPLFQGNYNDIPNWNDRISSIKVFKHDSRIFPIVQFFVHSNYGGQHQTLAATGPQSNYNQPFFDNDSISSMKVPQGTKVVLYTDVDFKGTKREFAAGNYPSLSTFGWNDRVSSIQIINPGLELVHIEYLEEITVPNGNPVALSSAIVNESDVTQKAVMVLTKELSESSTRSFSNSTMIGISVSSTAKVGISGPLSAEVSTTITSTLENTFTIGEEDTVSETVSFGQSLEVVIPPKSVGTGTIILTPQKYDVKVRYTFRLIGTDITVTEDANIFIETYHESEGIIDTYPVIKTVV